MKKILGYSIIALFIFVVSFAGALADGNAHLRALMLGGIGLSFALIVTVITLVLLKACKWIGD